MPRSATALLFGLLTPVAGWLYATSGGQAFWPMAALALAGSAISLGALAGGWRSGGVSEGRYSSARWRRQPKRMIWKCLSNANARRISRRSIRAKLVQSTMLNVRSGHSRAISRPR